jgi:hypothetical protein
MTFEELVWLFLGGMLSLGLTLAVAAIAELVQARRETAASAADKSNA